MNVEKFIASVGVSNKGNYTDDDVRTILLDVNGRGRLLNRPGDKRLRVLQTVYSLNANDMSRLAITGATANSLRIENETMEDFTALPVFYEQSTLNSEDPFTKAWINFAKSIHHKAMIRGILKSEQNFSQRTKDSGVVVNQGLAKFLLFSTTGFTPWPGQPQAEQLVRAQAQKYVDTGVVHNPYPGIPDWLWNGYCRGFHTQRRKQYADVHYWFALVADVKKADGTIATFSPMITAMSHVLMSYAKRDAKTKQLLIDTYLTNYDSLSLKEVTQRSFVIACAVAATFNNTTAWRRALPKMKLVKKSVNASRGDAGNIYAATVTIGRLTFRVGEYVTNIGGEFNFHDVRQLIRHLS